MLVPCETAEIISHHMSEYQHSIVVYDFVERYPKMVFNLEVNSPWICCRVSYGGYKSSTPLLSSRTSLGGFGYQIEKMLTECKERISDV